MKYYLRRAFTPFEEVSQVWKIDENTAAMVGHPDPENGVSTYFRAKSGETIWDAIRRQTPWFELDGKSPFVPMDVIPGRYFPRIARPIELQWASPELLTPTGEDYANVIAIAVSQLVALTRHLERIFQTVHPSGQNLKAYGHDIRNLLILACTEVEAHWRGVLVANGVSDKKFRTSDYFLLKEALRLEMYAVTYPNYPWLPEVSPFCYWTQATPSQSLGWYDAYNATKHDREKAFERATLGHALEAVSACAVLIAAQFGELSIPWKHSEAYSFYQFTKRPSWAPSESYFYSSESNGAWQPVNYEFRR